MCFRLNLLLVFFYLLGNSSGANILFITLLAAPSHHIWHETLVGGLLKNGHNITMLGHDTAKIKSSNYTLYYIKDTYREFTLDPYEFSQLNTIKQILLEWDYQYHMCETDLSSEVPRKLQTYPRNHFDLILFDLGAGQCLYPLINYFSSAKTIGTSPFGTPPAISQMMGHNLPTYIPNYSSQYGTNMNLFEKVHNFFLQMLDLGLKYYYSNVMYKRSQEVFGKDIKKFDEVELGFDLLLTNNDPILDYPQPFSPNVIQVGGLQTKTITNKLTEELQNILDNSKNGVIYFSMGSIMKSKFMSNEVRNGFINVFSKLKQTVLWKFEDDGLKVPKNVIVRKWFPQNDILAHKNVKLFISHCGGLSTQEAIYHGIPVIAIPIIMDQHNNAAKLTSKGCGLALNYYEFSEEKLMKYIKEILNNQRYTNQIKRLSTLFKDQQVHPLDKAVFWVEYMLRNKETYKGDLNPRSRYLSFYQNYNIEILIFMCLFILLLVILKGVKLIFKFRNLKSIGVDKKIN